MDVDAYLDALASAEPAPGGGSAAALTGAMSAALCAMVARVTAASPKHADVAHAATDLAADADTVRATLRALQARDEAAYRAVVDAQRKPRATEAEKAARTAAVQAALAVAADVPLQIAEAAFAVFALADRTEALENLHLASDVACARHLARAAVAAAGENVRINHQYLRDEATVAAQRVRLAAVESRVPPPSS